MGDLLNSNLFFVVLAESAIIFILLAVILFQCLSTRRLRKSLEAGGKTGEDVFRPPSTSFTESTAQSEAGD